MDNIIFFFSGTGNSFAIAKDIAEELGSTKIIRIEEEMKEVDLNLVYNRVGFVFPAYFSSVPPIIERFISKLNFSNVHYVFSVITAGAMFGNATNNLSGLIVQRGGQHNAGFEIRMPGNYIAMYGAWPKRLQKLMLKKANKKVKQITQTIKEKLIIRSQDYVKGLIKSLSDKMKDYEKFALDYHVTEKCTGCEMCVRICPMQNITMLNGKPKFDENCERCMSCIQWCPTEAIQYKNKTEKRKHYRNPNVLPSDLFHEK